MQVSILNPFSVVLPKRAACSWIDCAVTSQDKTDKPVDPRSPVESEWESRDGDESDGGEPDGDAANDAGAVVVVNVDGTRTHAEILNSFGARSPSRKSRTRRSVVRRRHRRRRRCRDGRWWRRRCDNRRRRRRIVETLEKVVAANGKP